MTILRLAIAAWILLTLARAARVAWRQRRLVVTIWSGIRVRHLLGGVVLLIGIATVAGTLVTFVPGMDHGLGRLVGLTSNAVFAPLEEGLARAGPPPASGPDWALAVGASAFLLPLLLLLPWLAFVEEELFRAGLEHATRPRVAIASLGFGLLHLVMLIPLGAALAVGAAGAFYAAVYRRAYADGTGAPARVRRSYRPTRRARRATAQAAPAASAPAVAVQSEPEAPPPRDRQAAGVYAATVWHTTFNSLVVLLV